MDLAQLKIKNVSKCKLPPEKLPHNMEEAMLLMQPYGGKESETTGIMQYTYQSYVTYIVDNELSEILESLAINEMHHHSLLGKMITMLGGDPVIGADYRYWNAGFVNYTRDIREMLEYDLRDEKKGIEDYKALITKLSTRAIIEVIECIIEDEKRHVEILTELLESMNA